MFKMLGRVVFAIAALIALAACGGGGGGAPAVAIQQPKSAVLHLSAQGALPAGKNIAGIGITVLIPQGTTVKTDSSGRVNSGVVAPSGVAAQSTTSSPVYTPATATAPGRLSFVLASSQQNGFGAGEFATIICDVAPGALPKATDFGVTDFAPVDVNGAPILGLAATFVADIK